MITAINVIYQQCKASNKCDKDKAKYMCVFPVTRRYLAKGAYLVFGIEILAKAYIRIYMRYHFP